MPAPKMTRFVSIEDSPPRHGSVLALGPMIIPGVDPLDPRGLVPAALMLDDLEVRIPMWLPSPEPLDTPHRVSLFWLRSNGVESLAASREVHAPPPPLPAFEVLHVPLNILRESSGTVQLYYTVVDSEGQPSELDPKLTLTIDMNSPELLRPDDQLSFVNPPVNGVDEIYLINFDPVRFNLPPYLGREDNDRAEFFLSNSPNPPASAPNGAYTLASVTDPLVIEVPADAFRTLNNGPAYIFYQLYDEAGNYSTRSAGLPFVLNVIAAPVVPLPRPNIKPPAYDDSLIKRDDARADVFVLIDSYTNWASGDRVVVYWDGRPVADQEVFDGVVTEVMVPWSIMRGPLPDLIAEQVIVRYEIVRSGFSFPSFNLRTNVDFTVAGQDHANAPALLNLDLPVAEVWGLGSNTRNVIDHRDRDLGARARVLLYENPVPGQILRFFWNGLGPVASYTVLVGDVEGTLVFSSVIQWAVMEGIINPALPVHYTTSNAVNEQQSDNTPVNVSTGALIRFGVPILRHTLVGGGNYLSCCSRPEVFDGAGWHVTADDRFLLNDEVRFFWQGYLTSNGDLPEAVGTAFSDRQTFAIAEQLVEGLFFTVEPFDETIFPMRDFGSARGWYEVWRAGSLIGESVRKMVRIDLNYSKGGYCRPGDVISCTSDGQASRVDTH